MKKESNSMYKKFSIKDAAVILLSLAAIAILVFIILQSRQNAKQQQEQLDYMHDQLQMGDSTYTEDIENYLVINEVNQAGWIEIYNSGDKSIRLSGYSVQLNNEPVGTVPDATMLDAKSFYVLKLAESFAGNGSDVLALYDGEGNCMEQMLLPALQSGESYGCISEDGVDKAYMIATEGESNVGAGLIQKKELVFSVPGGFYEESFYLQMDAPKGCTVYYTLDGTEPTVDSEVYTEPLYIQNASGSNMIYAIRDELDFNFSYKPSGISMGTVVRAIAVDADDNVVAEKTQSYFVGLAQASDFVGMPVISITTDPVHLFDYFEGIYVKGRSYEDALARGEDGGASANYFNGWEKPVYVEYFESGKDKTFEGALTLSMVNDISITQPQKSFLLTGENVSVGAGSGLADYLGDGSDSFLLQTNRRDVNYKLREYIAADLLAETAAGVPQITPCIVFIDGEYWGGYMLRANYDARYVAGHYGVAAEEVAIAVNGVTADATIQAELTDLFNMIATADMSVQENYEQVKAQMDIESYLDYFCANLYLANADYGTDTLTMWRTTEERDEAYYDGKWRFLMPKIDNSMNNGAAGNICTPSINTYLRPAVSQDPIFQALLANDEFKEQLMQTMEKMANETFAEENVTETINAISAEMRRMVISSYKRFTGNPSDTFFSDEVKKIQTFFAERGSYILLYTEEVINGRGNEENVDEDADEVPEGVDNGTDGEQATGTDS